MPVCWWAEFFRRISFPDCGLVTLSRLNGQTILTADKRGDCTKNKSEPPETFPIEEPIHERKRKKNAYIFTKSWNYLLMGTYMYLIALKSRATDDGNPFIHNADRWNSRKFKKCFEFRDVQGWTNSLSFTSGRNRHYRSIYPEIFSLGSSTFQWVAKNEDNTVFSRLWSALGLRICIFLTFDIPWKCFLHRLDLEI